MHQSLIGVHHLLHVQCLVAVVGEGSIIVVFLIQSYHFLLSHRLVECHHLSGENASGEVSSVGDEIDSDALCIIALVQCVNNTWRSAWTQFVECLRYLVQVLVYEQLIHREVVIAP